MSLSDMASMFRCIHLHLASTRLSRDSSKARDRQMCVAIHAARAFTHALWKGEKY